MALTQNFTITLVEMGFTLIELIVAVTLLAALLILGIPSFKTMMMNNRIMAETGELSSALNYARNTALTQNLTVVTCPLADPNSTACGGNWQSGWIVYSQAAGGAQTLLLTKTPGPNAPILSAVAINGPAASSVTFDARGIATTQAYFKICDERGGAFAQSIEVLPTGYVQTGSTVGSAVWDGTALTCP